MRSLSAIINTVAFNTVVFLLGFSHLCAVFGDPGWIPLGLYPLERNEVGTKPQDWTMCTRCSMFRPPRAHHCRVCRRCVRRMDHHCPWINNCVGEYNQKYFVLFLIYVGILCIYALILVAVCRAVIASEMSKASEESNPIVVAHTVILVAICCLFGLFVLAIFSDQYKSIVEDETAVEAVQHQIRPRSRTDAGNLEACTNRRQLSKRLLFQEVFGSGPVYLWPFPCHHLMNSNRRHHDDILLEDSSTHLTQTELHARPVVNDDSSGTDSSSV
ncbi:palmitoyltransferase ZDHHC3/7/25 [Paragonimus westermani]|uniref:Palmitoyltransferase n=1 Tax=Paragonimus westermani TaxID=34504 RepID=A0A5J4NUB4_9TREM|nr:palmitoyltransferase ZDHHC3/7/25 [Paragonimus westermani]